MISRVNQFLILFCGRTGSTLLVDLLNRHPNVLALGEGLVPLRKSRFPRWKQEVWTRRVLRPIRFGAIKAAGFKTKLTDIEDPTRFARLLRNKGVLIIRMQRRNRIKQTVSLLTGKRLRNDTGRWNIVRGEKRATPVHVDPEVFDRSLAGYEAKEKTLLSYVYELDLETTVIEYEHLLLNRQAVLHNVFQVLGVDPLEVSSRVEKHVKDDLRKVIQNFDELRERYVGTPYESMFDEVLAP